MTRFFSSLLLLLTSLSFPLNAAEQITLQLKWQHQFQFAGYYAAKAKGYYDEVGLEVSFIEATPGLDPIDAVLSGDADYGVGSNSLLLAHQAGKPVVALAVVFQHSPYILLAKANDHIETIHDLVGKNIMLEPHAEELEAYLLKEKIPLTQLDIRPHNFTINALINDDVDVISAYLSDEPYLLNKENIPYHYFSPRSVGIDFYGDNLFTSQQQINQHPEQVANFRKASLRGWKYALENPDEIITLIIKEYSDKKSREQLTFEYEKMLSIIHPDLIELGYMLPGRWHHIAETYTELEMLPSRISLDGFLYQHNPERDLSVFYWSIAATSLISLIIAFVAWRFISLNRELNRLLYFKNRYANIGQAVDNITHQWKQPLNELSLVIMQMQMHLNNEPKERNGTLIPLTEKCTNIIEFMSKTATAFRQQINNNHSETAFDPKIAISETLSLVKESFSFSNIHIKTSLEDNIQLYGSSAEFSNVILSILLNSRNIFSERNTTTPQINLSLSKGIDHIVISIEDNGGGIKIQPIEKVFSLGATSSYDKDAGLGLYTGKKIITDKFEGSILAKNIPGGALFKIVIPLS